MSVPLTRVRAPVARSPEARKGVPDHPGIDGAAREGRDRVAGRQEDRRHRLVGHAGLRQGLDQEVMDVRALVQGDLLAAQIGDGLDRAVLGDEDRLAERCRRLVGDVEEIRVVGLPEDRRRLPGRAEIDGPGIQRLQQRRPRGELGPAHPVAERRQLLLQQALALQQDQRAVFLVADADDLVLGARQQRAEDQEREGGEEGEGRLPRRERVRAVERGMECPRTASGTDVR